MKSPSQMLFSTSAAFYLLSSPLVAMTGEEIEREKGKSAIPVKSSEVEKSTIQMKRVVLKAAEGERLGGSRGY